MIIPTGEDSQIQFEHLAPPAHASKGETIRISGKILDLELKLFGFRLDVRDVDGNAYSYEGLLNLVKGVGDLFPPIFAFSGAPPKPTGSF